MTGEILLPFGNKFLEPLTCYVIRHHNKFYGRIFETGIKEKVHINVSNAAISHEWIIVEE